MATVLQKLVDSGIPKRGKRGKKRSKRTVSSDSESEDSDYSAKRTRDDDDAISISASDNDIQALLDGSLATGDNTANVPNTSGNTAPGNQPILDQSEIELLESLNSALNEEEQTGPKIVQNLADIAITRWGKTITTEKFKILLSKHDKPENCAELTVPKVNPEIWTALNNSKKSADLRLGNIQQTIQKATFGMLKTCDTLLSTPTDTKTALSHAIDAVALMGHSVGVLSRIRRDQIRPALKPEFYSLCNKANEPESSSSAMLFGDDLAKQVCDAKETNTISQSIGANRNCTF
ncbi:uncharacterized protein LOC114537957 [Dendronephthya gigantea]|uniref:uncharacterized protein LOC114537957 n=1 Tax=Dendronephthya gigantea TaxID=151771 RepID=UPI00106D4204|nr:uncharacterized protein LOC114537957 [Dendronephthya gigantea]